MTIPSLLTFFTSPQDGSAERSLSEEQPPRSKLYSPNVSGKLAFLSEEPEEAQGQPESSQ